jgi:hypothetical protein
MPAATSSPRPLPYRVDDCGDLRDADDALVAIFITPGWASKAQSEQARELRLATAEYVCRAVNEYPALAEALAALRNDSGIDARKRDVPWEEARGRQLRAEALAALRKDDGTPRGNQDEDNANAT